MRESSTELLPTLEKPLRVGELSRRTGKTVRALHLYEEMGLLRPVHRSKGGFRLFAPSSVARVEWIAKLNEAGFSLHELKRFLSAVGPDSSDASNAPSGSCPRSLCSFTLGACHRPDHAGGQSHGDLWGVERRVSHLARWHISSGLPTSFPDGSVDVARHLGTSDLISGRIC